MKVVFFIIVISQLFIDVKLLVYALEINFKDIYEKLVYF